MRYRLTIDLDRQWDVTQIAYDLYDDQGERRGCWVSADVDPHCCAERGLAYLLARLGRSSVQGVLEVDPFP